MPQHLEEERRRPALERPDPRRWQPTLRLGLAIALLAAVCWHPRAAEAIQTGPARSLAPLVIELSAERYGLPVHHDTWTEPYPKAAVKLERGQRIEVEFEVAEAGDYLVQIDALAGPDLLSPPEGQLYINGQLPAPDAPRIVFPMLYHDAHEDFPLDRYGNQILIPQQRLMQWVRAPLRDVNFSRSWPITVSLGPGHHTLAFELAKASLYLGSIYLQRFTGVPSYRDVIARTPAAQARGVLITLEAERPTRKNDTAIRPINSRSLAVTPYDTYRSLLNTLGGESWQRSGGTVYYAFSVPEDGHYHITLRALQNRKENFTVFRRIWIDGELPFAELNEVPIPYAPDWQNVTLGDAQPYRIYLTRGEHVLGIEATYSPYSQLINNLQRELLQINQLALEIRRLTGNQLDRFREWSLLDYIPDAGSRLQTMLTHLRADKLWLETLNAGRNSAETLSYRIAIDNLEFLAADIDAIPRHIGRLVGEGDSAAQRLSLLQASLESQPLVLDKIFIHTPDVTPPPVTVNWLEAALESLRRFWRSFQPDPYYTPGSDADELEVWVNRPRQYVDVLQTVTDQHFTPQTGIRVKYVIMPDEARLVLANAAGIQPDVALGVSTHIPYELAIRNALYDLRAFDDFNAFIRIYSPGALLSYIINDSVYAIPETQDFWVTFYRKDILEALGLPVPRTWDEVLKILPELQRFGMNYNTPLSSGSGFKGYLFTAPFLFNFGAQLYSPDGMSSGLGSEEAIRALRFMAECFTVYGMPLTTASFYESFRQGSLPIGISNFETYLKLTTAAPELRGLWDIDLYPATVWPDGSHHRYATGSAQASILFKGSRQPQNGWAFLKWWMSTPTQIEFAQQLLLNYGAEYLWNTANLEAFRYLPIPETHKAVILEQWQWLQEPVRLPGSYMQERELSNAWNRIVFDGVNPRIAIDAAILTTNREILRKMEEFGYAQGGRQLKAFRLPTLQTVKGWMADAR
ncbi:MAG: extracellular solute-binding protein [Anaerolineae bacterium]